MRSLFASLLLIALVVVITPADLNAADNPQEFFTDPCITMEDMVDDCFGLGNPDKEPVHIFRATGGGSKTGAIYIKGTTTLITNATVTCSSIYLNPAYGPGWYYASTNIDGTYFVVCSAPGYKTFFTMMTLANNRAGGYDFQLTPN